MTPRIIHSAEFVSERKTKFTVCAFDDSGRMILDAASSAHYTTMHLSREDAIKLRDLLDDAIASLPRPIDLSNVHPVMAEAIKPFLGATNGQ